MSGPSSRAPRTTLIPRDVVHGAFLHPEIEALALRGYGQVDWLGFLRPQLVPVGRRVEITYDLMMWCGCRALAHAGYCGLDEPHTAAHQQRWIALPDPDCEIHCPTFAPLRPVLFPRRFARGKRLA
jgi:hypothetical protein